MPVKGEAAVSPPSSQVAAASTAIPMLTNTRLPKRLVNAPTLAETTIDASGMAEMISPAWSTLLPIKPVRK
ncbi:hypothetical protein D3C76_1524570 [compost metagenome]